MLFLAGEYGLSVEINSGPLMGGTAPVTVAGCVLQNNIEILSLLTISQLAHPGTLLIHRDITRAMNMLIGSGVMGSIECVFTQVAQAQLI
jgi:trimethylamine--corrinoid protein Co-methyltransferase